MWLKQVLVSTLNIIGSVMFLFMLAMIGLLLTMAAILSQIPIPTR